MATIAAMRVLAHQGGWDEILFVLAPLLIFAGLLALARRRVGELEQASGGDATCSAESGLEDERGDGGDADHQRQREPQRGGAGDGADQGR